MPNPHFHFKRFTIQQDRSALKVGTDGVLLGAWTNHVGAKRILDIGTGTGLLALIAAQRNSEAMIDAVEIDDASAGQATENARASPWSDRVRIHRMDVRRMKVSEPYDLIISNPPFYAGEMISADDRAVVAKHEAALGFKELMVVVNGCMALEGRFSVILPTDREHVLRLHADALGIRPLRRCVIRYLASRAPKRVMLEMWRGTPVLEHDEVTVEETPGNYSARYRELLADFMLQF